MQPNPYTPPRSELTDALPPLPPRPISVWLFLVVFLIPIYSYATVLGGYFSFAASNLSQIYSHPTIVLGVILPIPIGIGLLAIPVGIFRRKQWGRWIGVIALIALAALFFLAPDKTVFRSEAEKRGSDLARFIFPILIFWWIYAFGFSQKARRYFSRKNSALPPKR